ncbi:hypothetical protein GCM10012275_38960 [Longimycelium tulufanense]|uniref:Uncharacterized protein n=1 Tax=Longimycelium tulufanense TaxID=907463 RepID=A0A8J3FX20_9PSEU|nr:hypothetical protein GCM10012275_38960 [Longimycelium tulufanense]
MRAASQPDPDGHAVGTRSHRSGPGSEVTLRGDGYARHTAVPGLADIAAAGRVRLLGPFLTGP